MLACRIVAVGLLVSFCGCVRFKQDPSYTGPQFPPAKLELRSLTANATSKIVQTNARYITKVVTLSATNEFSQELRYYDVQERRGPLVIISPVSGGGYEIEHGIAKYIASRGHPVVIVERPRKTEPIRERDFVTRIDEALRNRLEDHRRAVDWITAQPELKGLRIGLIGISKGTIDGSLIMAHDQRIEAGVLVLAGGDLPYILTYSSEPGLKRDRAALFKNLGITPEVLYTELKEGLTLDPIKFAKHLDARRILMMLGACDTMVPYKKGIHLRESIGKPQTVVMPTGHLTAIFAKPYIQRKSLQFLRKKLEPTPEVPAKK